MRTWLITGCSTGLGRALAEAVLEHGTQPGDPAKAARAIIAAVESGDPPALLLQLGNDALAAYGAVLDAQRAEMERWRTLSAGTDLSDR